MKVLFTHSLDFNQTLVFSVFGHLLILIAVLFLPKPVILENPVIPAFMVNLVSEPSGYKSPVPKRAKSPVDIEQSKPVQKSVENETAPLKPVKQSPVKAKTVAVVKTPNVVLEALNKLDGQMAIVGSKAKNMVEELDQLARLETKAPPAKPIEQKPIAEKTFQELETLKNKKIQDKRAVVPVPLHKDVLADFEVLKMEESRPEVSPKEASLEKPQELVAEKKEPEKPEVPDIDLLKELEQLAKIDALPVLVPGVKMEKPELKEGRQKSSKSYDPIIEKLRALSVDSEPVTVEVSRSKLKSSRFKSKLRVLPGAPSTARQSKTEDSYVVSKKEGALGADVKSLYVGSIQGKIFKNWREPLAEEHNQETIVSFYIFPGGNIDKPVVKKSSGVAALDTLAVRAVLDSVLFPKFPKELKMSNLHVNIYFKYVPKDE